MTDGGLSFPDQPRVELDRRIGDLVDAANEVLAAQGRLRALLRATHAITEELEFESVLRTIVDSARALTGAERAALGIRDVYGAFEQVVREPAEAAVDSVVPHDGSGAPVLADDEAATGAPPTPRDVLAVPVRIRGAIFGDLYLRSGVGRSFADEDEQLVRSLAATAGYALEHAQLYREAQRREEFSVASAAVTAALLEEDEEGALALATERVHDVLLADSVFLALLDEEDGQLNVVAASGQDPDSRYNTAVPLQGSLLQRVLEEGRPTRIDERSQRDLHIPTTRSYGPIMALPLTAADRFLGGLVVARAPGARSFVETELTAAADFADRTSVALELHRARADQGRMRIFEDRGRIARDLHDRVIQQLFATGMQLQGVLGTLPAGQNADRVDAAVASLDGSIAQIRRIIFTLSSSSSAPAAGWRSTSRHRLLELVGELTSSLAVEPTITFKGPVDALLDPDLTEDVLAVVSEGVTNAVKHGAATEIAVSVVAAPTGITVIVTSNGEPVPSTAIAGEGRRSGLANLEERAQRRGGALRVRNVEGRPTMEWRVPPQPTR